MQVPKPETALRFRLWGKRVYLIFLLVLTWGTAAAYLLLPPSDPTTHAQAAGWGVLMVLVAIIVTSFVHEEWSPRTTTA